jgi:DNA polymerase-1
MSKHRLARKSLSKLSFSLASLCYNNIVKRLVLIDGKSVFYRGYYAMGSLKTKDGTPTGGVYGFTAMALEVIRKLDPDYVAVAWDKAGTNIRRRREI